MLGELLKPGITDEDSLFLLILLIDLEATTRGLSDDINHVLPLEGAQHSEEEVSLRQLVRARAAPWMEGTYKVLDPSWRPHKGSSLRALDIEGSPA